MTTEASGGVTQIPKKNYIINPTFSINQRGFAGGALSATAYGWDRWLSNGGAGNFTLLNGEVTIGAGDELQQRIESSQIPTGTVCTLSWEGTSLGYPAVSQGYTTTGHTSPYSFTMIQEDESGAGIGEYITFKEGTVKNPKLELGSVVTPFEIPDIGSEFNKCSRFFERLGNLAWNPLGSGFAVGTTQVRGVINFSPKRAINSFASVSSVSHFRLRNPILIPTNLTFQYVSLTSMEFVATTTGAILGQGSFITTNTNSGYIDINKEL